MTERAGYFDGSPATAETGGGRSSNQRDAPPSTDDALVSQTLPSMADRFPYYHLIPRDSEGKKDLQANLDFRKEILRHGASSRRAAEELWTMCARDLLFYINCCCWIFEPRAHKDKVIPFITYDFQDDALIEISDALGNYDLVIEKSRDVGVSWMVIVTDEHAWHFQDYSTFLFLSRKAELVDSKGKDPKSLFAKLDFLHQYQPEWLLPNRTRMRNQYSNDDNNSSVDGESTNEFAAIADRRLGLLLDEFSKMDNSSVIFRGTMAVTDNRVFTFTPEGTDNMAYAIAHNPNFRKLTLHWNKHPVKSRGLYLVQENGSIEFLDTDYWTPARRAQTGICRKVGPHEFEGAPVAIEPDNPRFKFRSPWYDYQCTRADNPKEIAQELDIDYVGSSYQFFESKKLQRAIQRTTPPRRANLDYNSALAEVTGCTYDGSGMLELWMELDQTGHPILAGKLYVIGADISAGTGASNSVLVIGEAYSRHQVGEISTPHMRPDEFAVLAVSLCKWLGNAELIWEAPGPGRGFASKVFDLGYRNVWFPGKPKWRGALSNKKKMPGWNPVKEEKRELFEEYRRAVFEADYLVQSRPQLDECRYFVYKPGGWIEHTGQSGGAILDPSGARENHGDRPTAGALCWKRMVELVPHALTAPKPEADLGYARMGSSPSWEPQDLPTESSTPVPDGCFMQRRIDMIQRREQQNTW